VNNTTFRIDERMSMSGNKMYDLYSVTKKLFRFEDEYITSYASLSEAEAGLAKRLERPVSHFYDNLGRKLTEF